LEVEVALGDITDERTEAIVNAANERLAHSGGVAAAILRAGGTQIMLESNNIVNVFGPIKVGKCVFTSSGKLAANGIKYVIHAVGPEYNKSKSTIFNAARLYKAVFNSLKQANKLGCASVSIPAVSSGIFGFPKQLCA
jgi:O-acetyl-ADP-ribose deacetylase